MTNESVSTNVEPIVESKGAPTVVGLFSGIGGLELGLHEAGFVTASLCEIDEDARRVLRARFPDVTIHEDVLKLDGIPKADVLTAGFPCQDLSMAGRKTGIGGRQSSLVGKVFDLLGDATTRPRWLVLENVPYMLYLDGGEGMRFLTTSLEALGFNWAYRVVDARAFGIPQRRQRVILVASETEDPRRVLFADEAGEPPSRDVIGPVDPNAVYGFYWTEGSRGLGWAGDAVPTIKGGSGLGIPSPPAVWVPGSGRIGTPDIRDAERLQGFPENWTEMVRGTGRKAEGARWRLLGNAVCVPTASWIGDRLITPGEVVVESTPMRAGSKWPKAAWGDGQQVHACKASAWPVEERFRPLGDFLRHPLAPLSERATAGFLSRAWTGIVRFSDGFLDETEQHLRHMEQKNGTGSSIVVA